MKKVTHPNKGRLCHSYWEKNVSDNLYQSGSQQKKEFLSDGSLEDILHKGFPIRTGSMKGEKNEKWGHQWASDSRCVTTPGLKGHEEETGRAKWAGVLEVGSVSGNAAGQGRRHCHSLGGSGKEPPSPLPSAFWFLAAAPCLNPTQKQPVREPGWCCSAVSHVPPAPCPHTSQEGPYLGRESFQMYLVKDLEMKSSWV